jgi:hypothetical protein
MGLLVRRSIRDVVSSNSKAGHQNLLRHKKILHRNISIRNVLITEDEDEGFIIDLDYAIRVDREEFQEQKGVTGTQSIYVYWLVASELCTTKADSPTVSWMTLNRCFGCFFGYAFIVPAPAADE